MFLPQTSVQTYDHSDRLDIHEQLVLQDHSVHQTTSNHDKKDSKKNHIYSVSLDVTTWHTHLPLLITSLMLTGTLTKSENPELVKVDILLQQHVHYTPPFGTTAAVSVRVWRWFHMQAARGHPATVKCPLYSSYKKHDIWPSGPVPCSLRYTQRIKTRFKKTN